MSNEFEFDEDAREELMLPGFSDNPIGTDDQIASYISKIETVIRNYPKLDDSQPMTLTDVWVRRLRLFCSPFVASDSAIQ